MDWRKRALVRFISDISCSPVCRQVLDFLFGDQPEPGCEPGIRVAWSDVRACDNLNQRFLRIYRIAVARALESRKG